MANSRGIFVLVLLLPNFVLPQFEGGPDWLEQPQYNGFPFANVGMKSVNCVH